MKMTNYNYDVVVVGTGNAALSAALSAGEDGLKVLMVEKGPKHKRGGNSFFTDGAIRTAYGDKEGLSRVIDSLSESELEKIELPEYTEEDYYGDIMKVTQGKSDPALADHLSSKSYETILWMKEQGVEFQLNENQYFEKDGKKVFWGGLPIKTVNKGIGLVEALFEKAEEHGIDIWYESPAVSVEKTDGKISGVHVDSKEHGKVLVECRSVILACGGFEANKEKRSEHLGPQWENAVVRGSEYNTGDGISMALDAGAAKAGQYDGCHAH